MFFDIFILTITFEAEATLCLPKIDDGSHGIGEARWILWEEFQTVAVDLQGKPINRSSLDRDPAQRPRTHLSTPGDDPYSSLGHVNGHKTWFEARTLQAPYKLSHPTSQSSGVFHKVNQNEEHIPGYSLN